MARKHANKDLIPKSLLTEGEHMGKLVDLIVEEVFDKLGLHLRRQLLVKLELFNDHIVVMCEGLFVILTHYLGDLSRKPVRFVLLLYLEHYPLISLQQTMV